MVTCAWCGTIAELLPLSWTASNERGGLRYYCDRCSRQHVRSIEGRLDAEHWRS